MPTHKVRGFDEHQLIHTLTHYLPSQGPLKDFVHHNTLHAFQDMKFYDAIFKASAIFGYQTTFTLQEYRDLHRTGRIAPEALARAIAQRKGTKKSAIWHERAMYGTYDEHTNPRFGRLRRKWREQYPINLDNTVQPLLFRILNSYLDQGISLTPFPFETKGLIPALRELDARSSVSFFRTKRARKLLHGKSLDIAELLEQLVGRGNEAYYDEYIYDQQFGHRGWSGMVATLEQHPESLMYAKKISLRDMIVLELLLEIDTLTQALGTTWQPLGNAITEPPIDMFADKPISELQEVLEIWQDAFEWSYYDTALAGLLFTYPAETKKSPVSHRFQAVFCIDEREYSLRTHVETLDSTIETYGVAGFFGVEFYFQPTNAKFYDKLCPAPVTPKYLIREIPPEHPHDHGKEIMYTKHSHRLVRGLFYSYLLGIPALGKLIMNIVNPQMSPAIANAFSHMDPHAALTVEHTGEHDTEKDLQVGFTISEMTDRVEKILRAIGLTSDFSSLVYIIGHGSSSANNPHHGAHDCGACSGRPGLVNARVFAHMANHSLVREELEKRGIAIPDFTQFVGAMHDTASDEMAYYDTDILHETNAEAHAKNVTLFEDALDLDAKERSRRFKSINTKRSLKKVRKDIKKRSVSYYEPRPELGHGTNALCIVGRRDISKQLFLDRRAFLSSYDYRTDPDGTILAGVLAPLGVVCGGINLEYFFSRMDNYKLGAGTKLPHNVMGLIGVSNGTDGDLRAGLPLQMVEVHDPVRLLMVVEHQPQVVLSVISANPDLYEWFANEWINLVALDPTTRTLHVFREGAFVPYEPYTKKLPAVHNLPELFESSLKMKTNHILDATQENLPVHIIKK